MYPLWSFPVCSLQLHSFDLIVLKIANYLLLVLFLSVLLFDNLTHNFVKFLFAALNYELPRDNVQLVEILGEGQFGDVYKGVYYERVSSVVGYA